MALFQRQECAQLNHFLSQQFNMRRVVLESPYSGKTPEELERNIKYAQMCLLDSLRRGEAPIASHLLHTQVLNDDIEEQRKMGIAAGHAWIPCADAIIVYEDYGISGGMARAIADAGNVPVENRRIISEAADMEG